MEIIKVPNFKPSQDLKNKKQVDEIELEINDATYSNNVKEYDNNNVKIIQIIEENIWNYKILLILTKTWIPYWIVIYNRMQEWTQNKYLQLCLFFLVIYFQ